MQQDDRIFAVVGACIVSVVALVAALIWLGSGITVEAPQRATVEVPRQTVPTQATSVQPVARVSQPAPTGRDEDRFFREAVGRLSAHPVLASYLVNDRLLNRFVRAVDAIAGGYSPAREIEFLEPQRPFVVREDEGQLVIAAGSYRRYDLVTEVFDSLDTDGTIQLYRQFRPQLEAIYREVGWADDDFDTRLRDAVDHLLEVTLPGGDVEVEQRAIIYAYAEDRFENLTGAQKHLLRMGPRNAATVQNKLRELRQAMGWPMRRPAVVTAELEQPVKESQTVIPLIADAAPMAVPDPAIETAGADEAP